MTLTSSGSADSATRHAVVLRSISVDYPVGRAERNGSVVHALADIDLFVEAGERVALLGPSGAGKSTLLDVLAGLAKPTAGSVEVLGSAITSLGASELRRHRARVAMVRQSHGLPGQLRVIHNVNGGRLGAWSTWRAMTSLVRPRCRAEVDEALEQVGLSGLADRRTADLSGGQQQRVAVARALMQKAELLLADEPVSAVDPTLSDDVVGLLGDAASSGRTLVVSLHDPALARRHVDRVVGLRHGRIEFDLAVGDVSDAAIDALYRSSD